jgi:manganese/zinc/iron transport system ATP- binding protein
MIIQVEKPVLEVHDLTVSYHQKPVLWGVDFSLPGGVMAGIMGPNGSGKSTLLKSIMGLLSLSGGRISVFSKNLDEVRKKVSYVPQKESVDWDFPATVKDVVMMGRYGHLGLLRRPGKIDQEIVEEALEQVNMQDLRNRQLGQLSGGQQQRVFLARALAQQADLYLMDEPFVGVDAATEQILVELLIGLKQKGKTLIVVHHNLQTAPDYFDWLVLLNQRLVASAPFEQAFTAALLQETYGGRLNMLSTLAQHMKKEQFAAREHR